MPDQIAGDAVMTQTQARRITRELLDAHGLTDWRVTFNRARRAAGSCHYGTRTITLSTFVLAQVPHTQSLNVITHEVAHALTKGHHHDFVWQCKHRELGGDGRRCYEAELVDDSAPWIAECEHGRTFHRYRAPRPGTKFHCKCRGFRGAPFTFNPNTGRVTA